MTAPITDVYGRTFRTLRLSLTNKCNLACVYCVHSSDTKNAVTKNEKILEYTQLAGLVKKIHAVSPLTTVRLTGGEPTLYKDLIPLVHALKAADIPTIKMTSNGYALKGLLPKLADAGLNSINISLDAVEQIHFHKLSGRKNLSSVFDSIDQALKLNIPVKLNAVILKSINEDQILPLLRFSMERNIPIRFLELMRMGPLFKNSDFETYFLPQKEILDTIQKEYHFTTVTRQQSATANYWKTSDGYQFGIIANESHPFCQDCNRLRMDSYGTIYGCLSNEQGISISAIAEQEIVLKEKIRQALAQKQTVKFTGSALSMITIGG